MGVVEMYVCSRCGKATKNAPRPSSGRRPMMRFDWSKFTTIHGEPVEYDRMDAEYNRLFIRYENVKKEMEQCGKEYERLSEKGIRIKKELNQLEEAINEYANSINRK